MRGLLDAILRDLARGELQVAVDRTFPRGYSQAGRQYPGPDLLQRRDKLRVDPAEGRYIERAK
jgi:hypothetical protein